jgi:hypothetical protein
MDDEEDGDEGSSLDEEDDSSLDEEEDGDEEDSSLDDEEFSLDEEDLREDPDPEPDTKLELVSPIPRPPRLDLFFFFKKCNFFLDLLFLSGIIIYLINIISKYNHYLSVII